MKMKYVDAATTAEKISDKFNIPMAELVDVFAEIPAADAQPIRHGRWTYPYKDKDINQCSECLSYVQDNISNVREVFAYCPFCGARMDGDIE
jgi:hypothetical protein